MPTPAILLTLPDGPDGIRETLKAMRVLVLDGKRQPTVRAAALKAIAGTPEKDFTAEAGALWSWVRQNIRYVRDHTGDEQLHFAELILDQGAGDCDDAALLLAAMMESVGIDTGFVAVAFEPWEFSHVLIEANLDGEWVAFDPTENYGPGWFPPDVIQRMIIANRED